MRRRSGEPTGRGAPPTPAAVDETIPTPAAVRGREADRAPDDRLAGLLVAIAAVVGQSDVTAVVRSLVGAATRLVSADYGAFAVLGSDGEPVDFVQYERDDEQPTSSQRFPPNVRRLAALVGTADVIRLDHVGTSEVMAEHPDGTDGEPVVGAMLGMPIRVRARVFGVLYLTREPGGPPFTAQDELQMRALGAQAGQAVANARALDVGHQREEWLQTLTTVATSLFSGRELSDVLPTVVRQARHIVDADFAAVASPGGDPAALTIRYGSGDDGEHLVGTHLPIGNSVTGTVMRSGMTVGIDDLRTDPAVGARHESSYRFGPALFVPLGPPSAVRGVLVAFNRPGRPTFDKHAVTMLDAFAAQVAVSLELAERRHDATRLALLEERERIARDLHDVVIQRLFAIGLTLEGASHSIAEPDAGRRVSRAIDELDQTIKEIRTTIFGLQAPVGADYASFRARAVAVVDQAVQSLGFVPSLRFDGLIDTTVPDRLADQAVAVLREALSNAARHALARHIAVVLAVSRDDLTLTVTDDGVGIKDTGRRSGLRNMETRAKARGGQLTLMSREPSGTTVEWRVPLRPSAQAGGRVGSRTASNRRKGPTDSRPG
jgi:signal transduction histidine kinase